MKKYSFYLTAALSLFIHGTICNLTASGQEIVVEFDPKVANVQLSNKNLVITPLDKKTTFYVGNENVKNKIFINSDDNEFSDEVKPMEFKEDIIGLEKINKSKRTFSFHNAGYLHAANEHKYSDCVFHFEKLEAAVALRPSSQSYTYNSSGTDIFSNILINMLQNNSSNALQEHKSNTPKSCFLKEMSVQSFSPHNVNIQMTLKYEDNLSLDSWWKNPILKLTPNDDFFFKLPSRN